MTSRGLLLSTLFAIFLIAGCAHKQGATGTNSTKNEAKNGVLTTFWVGRISLTIKSDPEQAFFAGFTLKGQADNGELALVSPLGNILGIMRWSPTEAVLEQSGNITRFASTDALLTQTTGAAVPISALFDWLSGKNTPVPGWTANLSQLGEGRMTAKKASPEPQADLRIVLDRP